MPKPKGHVSSIYVSFDKFKLWSTMTNVAKSKNMSVSEYIFTCITEKINRDKWENAQNTLVEIEKDQ